MFKKVIKWVENFIFEPEEEEINEAQYLTLLHFAKKTFITHAKRNNADATKLALYMVEQWIETGTYKRVLKNLWTNTKAA